MAGGDYSRIRNAFWTDPDIKRALTPEQKVLLLYYFSSPHTNLIGLYYCPLEYAAGETGIPLTQVREWTLGVLSRFVTYDESTEEILVHRAAKHQVAEQLKGADKRIPAVRRVLAEAHSDHLRRAFLSLYPDWPLGAEAPSKPLRSPIYGVDKPLRSHSSSIAEQELHTNAIALEAAPRGNETAGPGGDAPSGEPVVDPPPPAELEPEPDPNDDATFRALIAPLVREHLWLGRRPPPWRIGGEPITMGREISAARQLAAKYSPEEVLGAIECARAALPELMQDRPASLLLFQPAEKQQRFHLCVAEWRSRQTDAAAESVSHLIAGLGLGEGARNAAA